MRKGNIRIPRFSSGYIYFLLVIVIFGVAFFVRAYFPAEKIFGSEWVKFNGTDSYFHMRLVDNLVANFPRLTPFDPYHVFPAGLTTSAFPFFDWLLAAIIWVIGLGSASPQLVDAISVYYPAVLGALAVVPVYFLGKELFNRWAGVIAAVLVALLPGELLSRSVLGFTDHHVAEALLSSAAVLFFIMAIKSARCEDLTLGRLANWPNIYWPVIYSLFGGLFMGLYFLTWIGAELFTLILFVFLVGQIVIDHIRHRTTYYLGLVGVVFFITLIVVDVGLGRSSLTFPLLVALLVPPLLVVLSWSMSRLKLRTRYFPLAIFGLAIIATVGLYALSPNLFNAILQKFSIFLPTAGTGNTTLEMRPFFVPVNQGGGFFLTPAWLNLHTALPLAMVSFFVLVGIMFVGKKFVPERVFFILWSLAIFIITVQQRRFDYYFTINAALLTGYIGVMLYLLVLLAINYLRTKDTACLWRQIQDASGLEAAPQRVQAPVLPAAKKKKMKQPNISPGKSYLSHGLAVLLVFFIVVFPGLGSSLGIAKAASFVPSDAWCAALTWLKTDSPEPFGDPDAYYRMYQPPPPGETFDYPSTAYGVMSWWDYGYWITRIAHRIPITNPSQYPEPIILTSGVFLSQSETSAQDVVKEFKTGYVIVDNTMVNTKLWAIAQWNGQDRSDYYGTYYVRQGDQLFPRTFCYPEYYRSLVVRLYNFDGKAVTPAEMKVIAYEDRVLEGFAFRMVTDNQTFPDYQQAVDFMNSHEGNYRIVSDNPFTSAVPLEALGDYRLVFGSEQTVSESGITLPEVKIFKFEPD